MSAVRKIQPIPPYVAFLLPFVFLTLGLPQARAAAAAATTTTTLAVTANGLSVSSVDAGAAVTLTATAEAGGKPVALGQVNFCDATAALCSDIHLLGTVPLTSAGTAALKFVPRAGSHSYKAEFVSTVSDNASVSTAQPLLVYGTTTTAIAQSGSAGNYTLKATVTGAALESAPAGNVDFRDTSDSNAVLATAALGAGTSASTWVNTQNPATKPQPLSIAVGDFNGDGIPDIAIGTNGTITGYLSILLGNGDGTFQAAKSFTSLPNNQAMVAAHFVNGGPLDILTVDNNASGTNNADLFIGNGEGGGTVQAPFSLGGLANVTAVAAGDFNRDGYEDFVITGVIYGVYCFAPVLGSGSGTFGGPTLNAIGDYPLLVAVGAFNTSGYPDIVVVDTNANQATIFENNSQGYFFPEGQANTGTNPTAMVTGDFNGDGYLDLAITNSGSNNVTILLGKGNYTLTPAAASPATGHTPTSLAVGDFNGDGIADLAVVNSGDKTVSILLGKGDGTFTASTTLATGINPVNVATGDFSGTGLADLVVTNQDTAATTGSTLTVQTDELTQTASATATKVAPAGSGTHLVDANYVGDSLYNTSTSATTSLTGTAAPYTVSVAPTSLAFSGVVVGNTSAAQTVKLTNTGTSAVSISSVAASANFAVSSACGSSLAVGANCLLSVTFVPTVAGDLTGTLSISDNATGSPQTIALSGTATGKLQFIPITPCRIADTRNATGAFGGPELAGGATRTFDVPQSACGIPATAAAYSLNATVVPIASLGYLTVWPAGEAQPSVSTLNSDGRVKANATITPAGTNGGVSVYVSDATQFILDIDGYFVPAGTSSSGLEFFPVTPCRIADTRNPSGALGGPSLDSATSRSFPVQSSSCGIPATAKAYSLNVTAVPHESLGFLTAWPTGEAQPTVSTLNASTGVVTANAAIVPAGTSGGISIYVSDASDVILDINGYFASPATGGLSLYTVTPCRVLDTRNSSAFDGTLTIPVESSSCAPPSTAKDYVLNATVLPVDSLAYLSLWAAGAPQPVVSTLNASDGAITSNMAIVPTSNGSVDAYAAATTNLLLDISSYFAP